MAHYAVEYGITRHPLAFLFCSFSLFFSDIKCGSTDEPLFSTERLSKFKLGEALFVRQRQNPFFTKLLPYDKYVFYKKSKTQFEDKPKPTAKYIDVKEYINRGGKG